MERKAKYVQKERGCRNKYAHKRIHNSSNSLNTAAKKKEK